MGCIHVYCEQIPLNQVMEIKITNIILDMNSNFCTIYTQTNNATPVKFQSSHSFNS